MHQLTPDEGAEGNKNAKTRPPFSSGFSVTTPEVPQVQDLRGDPKEPVLVFCAGKWLQACAVGPFSSPAGILGLRQSRKHSAFNNTRPF